MFVHFLAFINCSRRDSFDAFVFGRTDDGLGWKLTIISRHYQGEFVYYKLVSSINHERGFKNLFSTFLLHNQKHKNMDDEVLPLMLLKNSWDVYDSIRNGRIFHLYCLVHFYDSCIKVNSVRFLLLPSLRFATSAAATFGRRNIFLNLPHCLKGQA